MLMEIQNVIVHRLLKGRNKESTLSLRAVELTVNDVLIRLLTKSVEAYTDRSSRIYGQFQDDAETYPFSKWLRTFHDSKGGTIDLS